jgi:hypothetical protein
MPETTAEALIPADSLHLDPVGGVAGDMFLAACLDAGVDAGALRAGLAALHLPGWRLEAREAHSNGIGGTHVDVVLEGPQPHERALAEILQLIAASGLSERAQAAATKVFRALGEAEAAVHRVPVEQIHFHEVGAVDALVDICGAAICLEIMGWPRVTAVPPPSGAGLVKSMHGLIPVPAPATLQLLRGRRLRPSGPGERTTPTGAALLAALAEEVPAMPDLVIERVGYGVGTRKLDDGPNVLRVIRGRAARGHATDSCVIVEANLDDATGQLAAHALEALLAAGAADAWLAPVVGKKGRPGFVLSAMVEEARLAAVQTALLRETPTLGVRWSRRERRVLDRAWREVETPWGRVRVKVGLLDGEAVNLAPEFDDCAAVANAAGVPLKQVLQAALAAAR